MGYLRNNLFVPLPQLSNLGAFNAKLLDKAMTLSDKPHWVKVDGAISIRAPLLWLNVSSSARLARTRSVSTPMMVP